MAPFTPFCVSTTSIRDTKHVHCKRIHYTSSGFVVVFGSHRKKRPATVHRLLTVLKLSKSIGERSPSIAVSEIEWVRVTVWVLERFKVWIQSS